MKRALLIFFLPILIFTKPTLGQKEVSLNEDYFEIILNTDDDVTTEVPTEEEDSVLRSDSWTVPLLAVSGTSMFLLLAFEAYVLYHTLKSSPRHAHLLLGQTLLAGLFLLSLLGVGFASRPSAWICGVTRVGLGVGYAIVFCTLLVKCVFLTSLNSGVYLPTGYQMLLLLFAVLPQIVISVQWLISRPPGVVTEPFLRCNAPYQEVLLSLTYVIFLIIFATVSAIRSRGIEDNHREAKYIGLALGLTIPVWIIWVLVGLTLGPAYHEPALAFGSLLNTITVFLIMFMPKGRHLAVLHQRSDGIYEAWDERWSGNSMGHSPVHSPSFLYRSSKTLPPPPPLPIMHPEKTINKKSYQEKFYRHYPPGGRMYSSYGGAKAVNHIYTPNPNVYFYRPAPWSQHLLY